MGKFNIEALKPGMVLAGDIHLPDRRILFPKGTILDRERLEILRRVGALGADIHVPVEPAADFPSQSLPPTEVPPPLTKDRLSRVFSRCDLEHPVFLELHGVIASLERATGILGTTSPEAGLPQEDRAESEASGAESTGWSKDPRSLIKSDMELISLPDIYLRIEGIINDPNSSARHIAAILSQDPNLSAKLLKIVNSALYGFKQKIDTISRAVTIVGHNQIGDLVMGTSVMALFHEIPSTLMNMNLFWEHSVACGICARCIAGFRKFPNTESFFIAGLLHDLGKLIIFKHLPQPAKAVLQRVRHSEDFYYQTERDVIGFDHAQVGQALAEQWKLPTSLEQAIGGHHPPWSIPPDSETALIFVADNIANALGYGSSGERLVSPELTYAIDLLSLPENIWDNLLPLIKSQIEDTVHLF
jgi:HD-like signal output (HDOD) protein